MMPTAQPLISVALCAYNGERYLRPQLDSLLRQTYANIEIVAADDASTDGTAEILAEYMRRDPRLRYFRNTRNLGFRRNFSEALLYCRGALVALCDQDDVWSPDKLAVLAEALLREDAVLAFCNSELIDQDGRRLGPRIDAPVTPGCYADPVSYIYRHLCSGHAMLLRRSLLDRAQPLPDAVFHDWWLAFTAASTGKVVYVDRCLVQYRRHAGSVTFRIDHDPQDRTIGFRCRELREVEARLALFAAFPGREQAFFGRLLALWRRRDSAILSCRLALFMLWHRGRLFPFEARRRRVRLALKHLWGLRLKRWMEPHRYAG